MVLWFQCFSRQEVTTLLSWHKLVLNWHRILKLRVNRFIQGNILCQKCPPCFYSNDSRKSLAVLRSNKADKVSFFTNYFWEIGRPVILIHNELTLSLNWVVGSQCVAKSLPTFGLKHLHVKLLWNVFYYVHIILMKKIVPIISSLFVQNRPHLNA